MESVLSYILFSILTKSAVGGGGTLHMLLKTMWYGLKALEKLRGCEFQSYWWEEVKIKLLCATRIVVLDQPWPTDRLTKPAALRPRQRRQNKNIFHFRQRESEEIKRTIFFLLFLFFNRLSDCAFLPGKPQHVLSVLFAALNQGQVSSQQPSSWPSAPAAFAARGNNLLRHRSGGVSSLVKTCLCRCQAASTEDVEPFLCE